MKREDSRKPGEMRPLEIRAGVLQEANGSALVKLGRTTAIAAVYGPRETHPRHLTQPDKALLRCYYNMAPFSTKERVRPGRSRRSTEIAKVTREALEPAVFLEEYPKASIEVFIEILQADAGTRTAGINAASVALADAGIPMRDLVTSIAAGRIGKTPTLDLAGKEEEETECDLPIAYMPREKKITLMQMDGDIAQKDLREVINTAVKACEEIYRKQREALRKRWIGDGK
jgi:exosome complex component RRP41